MCQWLRTWWAMCGGVAVRLGDAGDGDGVGFAGGVGGVALDEEGLRRGGKPDVFWCGEGLDGASFTASAVVVGGGVGGCLVPGQSVEQVVEAGPVFFDDEYVVRAACGEVAGVVADGVQGVGGDHRSGQVVDPVQQRGEPGDFGGLVLHLCLRHHGCCVMGHRG